MYGWHDGVTTGYEVESNGTSGEKYIDIPAEAGARKKIDNPRTVGFAPLFAFFLCVKKKANTWTKIIPYDVILSSRLLIFYDFHLLIGGNVFLKDAEHSRATNLWQLNWVG